MEWIDVNDRKPKNKGQYLVRTKTVFTDEAEYVGGKTVRSTDVCEFKFHGCEGFTYDDNEMVHSLVKSSEVTHWAELPEPPKTN